MTKKRIIFLIAGFVFLLGAFIAIKTLWFQQSKSEIGKAKATSKVQVQIDQVKTLDKKIVMTFTIKNVSKKPIGIGAGDFQLISNGKTYSFTEGDNFGGEIKPGGKLKGEGFYKKPASLKEVELTYTSMEKESLTWKLGNLHE